MKDTIIGVIAFSLFAAMLAYGFVQDIDHTYEQSIATAERAKEEQRQMAEQAHQQYIAPADEVIIEIMNKESDNESH